MKALSLILVFVPTLVLSSQAQQRDATPAIPVAPAQSVVVQQGTQTQAYVTGTTTNGVLVVTNRPIALRIVGSNVKNLKGEYLGRVDNVLLHPEIRQIEFALIDSDYPTNTARVTPVPWNHLNYVWDQGQIGGLPGAVQLFRLDIDKARFDLAPTIERTQTPLLLQPGFRQHLLAFYGAASEVAVGGAGSASTAISGAGASAPAAATTAPAPVAALVAPVDGSLIAQPGVFVVGVATNDTNVIPSTNVVGTATNLFPGATTNIATGTNIFPGTTNAFVATNVFTPTNFFAGTTNPFPGAPATAPATNATLLPPTGRTTVNPGTVPQIGTPPPTTQPRIPLPAPAVRSPFTIPDRVITIPPTTTPTTPSGTTPTPTAPPATAPATTPTPIAPPTTAPPSTPTPIAPPTTAPSGTPTPIAPPTTAPAPTPTPTAPPTR